MRGKLVVCAVVLAASESCGGGTAVPRPAPVAAPAVAERLGPFEWLVGRWQHSAGVEEWNVAKGALIGIGFTVDGARTRAFEVMIVRVADGRATFTAMPNGAVGVDFPQSEATETSVTFANPEHDFPKTVRYALEAPDALVATVAGDGEDKEIFRFVAAPPARAAELEARDAALDKADAERFVAAFDVHGAMWRHATGRVSGRDAIRRALASAFRGGGFGGDRRTTSSGLSPAGDLGYTVGPTHASVWRRQPDGSWLLAYDTAF